MAQSFADELQDFAQGLLNLEVNTITKDGMTARKMPVLPHALIDIVEKYLDFFGKIGLQFDGMVTAAPRAAEGKIDASAMIAEFAEPGAVSSRAAANGPGMFDQLRWAAAAALTPDGLAASREAGRVLSDEERVVLARVRRNCDQLKPVTAELAGMPAWKGYVGDEVDRGALVAALAAKPDLPPVNPGHSILIRKIWDIGDEIVEMQTVIQLDGDVITRIRRDLDPDQRAALLPLHQKSIDVSVKHWETLFSLIGTLIGDLLDRIFPTTLRK